MLFRSLAEFAIEYADALLSALYPAGEESVVRESLTTPATYGGWSPCPTCGKPMVNNPPPWGFPTMGGEHHSGDATEKAPDADGWIEHRPGDVMPCHGNRKVEFRRRDGMCPFGYTASELKWGHLEDAEELEIIAWRPAK